MKQTIFRKAILLKDKVKYTGSGQNKEFYEFDFGYTLCNQCDGKKIFQEKICYKCDGKGKTKNIIQVELTIEDNKMTISDTSLHGTYYPDSNVLNSYMLAVLYFKLKKQGG